MNRCITLAAAITLGCLTPAFAQELPSEGKFSITYTAVNPTPSKAVSVGDRDVTVSSSIMTAVNDAGSGPLHMAPVSGTYKITQETGKGEGELTWGNGDDQLKGSFTITATPDGKSTGENIVKGTGKLAGVTGGTFACADVGVKPEDQQVWCMQVFNRK